MINKRLIQTAPESMGYVKKAVIAQWLGLIFNLMALGSFASIIHGAYVGEGSVQIYVILVIAIVMRCICILMANNAAYNASKSVKKSLRKSIYDKLIALGLGYNEVISTSKVMQISTEGVEQIEMYFGRYLPQFFYSMLAPLTLFIVLASMNLTVAVILLVCVPLIPISIIAVNKFAKKLFHKYWGAYTDLGDHFLDNLQGITTLKVYGADEAFHKQMNIDAEHFRKITMKVLTMQLNSITLMDLIAYGGAALGIAFSLAAFYLGELNLGQTIFFILVTSEFFIPMRLLGSFFHVAMNGVAAAQSIFELLDMPDAQVSNKVTDFKKGKIEFVNVDFAYNKNKLILNEITFSTESKGLFSFVGKSGCGKSTIVSLLMGFKLGFSGEIKIGGVSINSIRDLNKHLCIVKHQSYLFRGTIKENLQLANPSASDKDMLFALKQVELLGEIEAKGGLDFILQENGSNLSGGQRQRLALARALVRKADIYIFDEATSNIDVESENVFNGVVKQLAKTKIVILISHRLANVVDSDKIFVVAEGRLVEAGTHKELMENGRVYADLFSTQAELEDIYNHNDASIIELSTERKLDDGARVAFSTGKTSSAVSGIGLTEVQNLTSGSISGGSSGISGTSGIKKSVSVEGSLNSDGGYDGLEKSLIQQGLYNPADRIIEDKEIGVNKDLSHIPQASLLNSGLFGKSTPPPEPKVVPKPVVEEVPAKKSGLFRKKNK